MKASNLPGKRGQRRRGIALIIVMIVITLLSILAGGFAYSMKVETRLARNAVFDTEMEWLGRSGIELARYVLGQQKNIPNEPYDALNQKWAGGSANTNGLLSDITLDNVPVGNGVITVKITDMERKFNINAATEPVLQQALIVVGVDAAESPPIIGSILDWIDGDDNTHINGTENDYYQSLDPPYSAKNGPLDDLAELLLVRGVSPEVYWGPKYTGPPTSPRGRRMGRVGFKDQQQEQALYAVGLVDLFSPFGSPFLNINTASQTTLQLIPEVDENVAGAIIARRAGPDGVDGTDDDMPFRSPMELMSVPGMNRPFAGQFSRFCSVQSTTFEVEVDVTLDQRKRKYVAVLRRLDQRNLPILQMYWK